MREDGAIKGTARSLGLFRRENEVEFGDQAFRLEAAGFWGRVWRLVDAGGASVLEIQPRGAFRRGATMTIPQSVDLGLLVLAYHLVNARWQEQTAAASAGAAAS